MTTQEAIEFFSQLLKQVTMTGEAHDKANEALEVLRAATDTTLATDTEGTE